MKIDFSIFVGSVEAYLLLLIPTKTDFPIFVGSIETYFPLLIPTKIDILIFVGTKDIISVHKSLNSETDNLMNSLSLHQAFYGLSQHFDVCCKV